MTAPAVRIGDELTVGPWKGGVARIHEDGTLAFGYVDVLKRKIRSDVRWDDDEERWAWARQAAWQIPQLIAFPSS